jgi:MarR family transcriptional regulator for hemolysin
MGVSWSSFQLLTTVANAGDKASQIEVATRLGVTAATLSESVQNHVDRGLLVQVPSPTDKRVRILQLTAQSEEMIRQIKALVLESDEAMTRGILPAELTTMAKVIDRIIMNLESELENEA